LEVAEKAAQDRDLEGQGGRGKGSTSRSASLSGELVIAKGRDDLGRDVGEGEEALLREEEAELSEVALIQSDRAFALQLAA
jgi:hypothetical protein